MDNKIHLPIIDVLRGWAALSVCLFHYVCTTTGYIETKWITDLFEYGAKGVQVFFIISGMVIPLSMINLNYSYSRFKKFILKRFIRIEPPYLVSVVIATIYLLVRVYYAPDGAAGYHPNLKDTLLHIGYLVPFVDGAQWLTPVYWTLSVEFQYYLYLALIIPLALSAKVLYRAFFYVLLLVPPLLVTGNGFFFHWSALFLLGIVYILWIKSIISNTEFWIVFIVSAVVVYFSNAFVDLIVGLLTVFAIHFFKNFTFSAGRKLGNISYSLYLLHTIVGGVFVNMMSHKFTLPYQKVIVILIGVFLSIAAASLFYRFIEKPSQNYSKKIK